MAHMLDLELREVSAALQEKALSPVELARSSLECISNQQPRLNAFVCLTEARAMNAARQAEREILAGNWRGGLHGVPVAVKDLYDMVGLATTASSRVRHDHIATFDAACVERLERAGAVIVGKTHTHEFAYGVATPATGNPWNLQRIPGGSSGGSGASVAARSCFMAMGTDTGGSIRIPAALCGIVGLKPTYGRVSRYGITSLSWSLDHAGPLTRTVRDAAVAMSILAGYDPRDPGSADMPVADYLVGLEQGVRGMRLGVPSNYYFDLLEPDVERNVRSALSTLQSEGAELVDIKIPIADKIIAVEFGLMLPEASAYHHDTLRTRRDLYEDDVRTLLEAGELVPATDYVAALRTRGRIQAAWRQMYADLRLDAIVAPTVPLAATPREQTVFKWPNGSAEEVIAALVRLSAPANVTGLPSIAVPCGFNAEGLPTSFQIIGRPFQEARILRIARAYEQTADWTSKAPVF